MKQYVMNNLRSLLPDLTEWQHLEQQIIDIENVAYLQFGEAIDRSYSLIQSICKTILKSHGFDNSGIPKELPKQFTETLKQLEIKPFELDSNCPMTKMTSGLCKSVAGISELRREYGTVSHGKPGGYKQVDENHVYFVLNSTDTICHFLLSLLLSPKLEYKRTDKELKYDDYHDYNEKFDSEYGDSNGLIDVGTVFLSPSEILFNMDIEAYKENVLIETSFTPIDILELNKRTIQVLVNGGISSIEQLLLVPMSQLLLLTGFDEECKKDLEIELKNKLL